MENVRMDINLEYYRVFYQVSRLGSITGAAKELCISQPAVSQAVSQLEKVLHCQLFVRTSKGVHLTEEGALLYSYVERGLLSIQDGEGMLRRLQDLETGEIRIGASDMTLQFYLLSYLEAFHEQHPGIKVMVSNAPTPETMDSLYEGKIDFGVVSTPFLPRPEVRMIPVKKIRNVFVAGEKFAGLKGEVLEYECLENLPCILLEQRTSTRTFLDEFLADNKVKLEPEFELATSDMIVQFALRNLGIGGVVWDFAREKLESGELFELKFSKEMPEREFCIVTDKRNPMSPAGRRLLEMMVGSVEHAGSADSNL